MRLQICFVIGERADDELTAEIKAIIDAHHPDVVCDQLRVYHSGRHYLVEIEVVMPRESILETVHDVSLSLQNKVEKVRRYTVLWVI